MSGCVCYLVVPPPQTFVDPGLGVHTTDLPQGNYQANVKKHNARFGYRFCGIESGHLDDIDFDTIANARHEHRTARLLDYLHALPTDSERERVARNHGLSTRQTQPFQGLIFDRHLQIPIDPAHCICQGLDAVLIQATTAVMSTNGKIAFAAEIGCMELPKGWARFQDPVNHIRSYFFSDLARLIMVGPLVLCTLGEDDYSQRSLREMQLRMGLRSNTRVVDEIISCWILLASTSSRVFAAEIDDYDSLGSSLYALAKQLVRVSVHVKLCGAHDDHIDCSSRSFPKVSIDQICMRYFTSNVKLDSSGPYAIYPSRPRKWSIACTKPSRHRQISKTFCGI